MTKRTRRNHTPVFSERDGSVRSFHVPHVSATTLRPIIVSHVNRATYIMTDDAPVYTKGRRILRFNMRASGWRSPVYHDAKLRRL
jgi:hypothetical protein